jgi:DNA-binding transcriptional LysR family regulator
VIHEGGFTAAAQKLGVTQSAVTQHVRKLEKDIGAPLFSRGQHGLTLTRSGADLFALAERFAALDQMIGEKIAGYQTIQKGHLSIIANAPQPALRLMSKFASRNPNIDLDFSLLDWTTAMGRLNSHEVDIAFMTEPTMSEKFHYTEIGQTKYELYTRNDHRLFNRKSISIKELEKESLLLPERGSLTQKIVTKALKKHGVVPLRQIKTTTFPLMHEAIQEGLGVGIFLSNASRAQGPTSTIPIREIPEQFKIFAVVPKYKYELRLIQKFLESLH